MTEYENLKELFFKLDKQIESHFYLTAEKIDTIQKNIERIEKRLENGDGEFKKIIIDYTRKEEQMKILEADFKEHKEAHKFDMIEMKQKSKDVLSRIIAIGSILISTLLTVLNLVIKK